MYGSGAETNVMDSMGASALALAAGNGKIEVVKALLNRGNEMKEL